MAVSNSSLRIGLALHAGAGAVTSLNYDRELDFLHRAAKSARDDLLSGRPALEVVVATVRRMEDSGLFVAGRGGSPNSAGEYELDASVMEGHTNLAGAVACLKGFKNPILVARSILSDSPHVLFAGHGASVFADNHHLERIDIDDQSWFTRAAQGEENFGPKMRARGTVGCVARDLDGHLSAGTSTAGVFDKVPGRVGDTPLIGAGTWADEEVATSATGVGEYFITTCACFAVSMLVKKANYSLDRAVSEVLSNIHALGGDGGIISVRQNCETVAQFNASGLKRAVLAPDGRISVGAFRELTVLDD